MFSYFKKHLHRPKSYTDSEQTYLSIEILTDEGTAGGLKLRTET